MARHSITQQTLRALFARSGNGCAYPGCHQELVDEEDLFVGQICHIEAAAPNGPRYNPRQTDEDRRSGDNLILLCYPHHKKTDDAGRFATQALKEMKAAHESRLGANSYCVSNALIVALAAEMDDFWDTVSRISRVEGPERPFPMAIDPLGVDEILTEIGVSQTFLSDLLEIARIGQAEGDWVGFHIGVPNHLIRLSLLLAQLRVRYYEQACLARPGDELLLGRLVESRSGLHDLAQSSSHVD